MPGGVPRAARVDGLPPAARARGARARGRARARRAAPADRRRRRRDLQRGDRRAARASPTRPASRCAETQAGRGALRLRPPAERSARSARPAPRRPTALAREADVVIGVGTRWSDFTTASKSAFQDPGVRFVNVNVAAFDAAKHSGLPLVADARVGARRAARGARRPARRRRRGSARAGEEARGWAAEVAPARARRGDAARCPRQAAIIGAVNDAAGETGVVVCAAGLGARRPAQALARARPRGQGLPRRVRLLVHGLRDPGRHGRQARRARARGLRARRRRLVPDAAGRARHRGRRAASRS